MENSEWGTRRPLSVTPDPVEQEGPPKPSLFSIAVSDEPSAPPAAAEESAPVLPPGDTAAPTDSQPTAVTLPVPPAQQGTRVKGRQSPDEARSGQQSKLGKKSADSGHSDEYAPLRLFKVVLVGDSGAGKTTYIQQLCTGRASPTIRSTVGVDYFSKQVSVDGQETSLKIWDTAGTEKYRSISVSYLRGADAVILMYDMTNVTSFTNIHSWMIDIRDKARDDVVILVVGNKCDIALEGSQEKVVPRSTAQSVVNSYNAVLAETSALTGSGVTKSCTALVRQLHKAEDKGVAVTRKLVEDLSAGKEVASDSGSTGREGKGCCG